MAEILGFGANQYRLYENGEMPSEAVGKTLRSIMKPDVFMMYVKNSENQFGKDEYGKILAKLNHVMNRKDAVVDLSFNCEKRSVLNGYAPQSYDKVRNIILFFINKLGGVFNTKMNKLLFYSDFYSYKTRGVGITGLAYRAIQFGPVPVKWNVLYSTIEGLETDIVPFANGNAGERLMSFTQPDMNAFTSVELNILETVLNKFAACSSTDISSISHQEDAWLKYKDKQEYIDYSEAFSLKAL